MCMFAVFHCDCKINDSEVGAILLLVQYRLVVGPTVSVVFAG